MSHTIGGIEVDFVPSNKDFYHWWVEFNPSTQVLPAGWKREEGRLALREALIWDKDVPVPMRDGTILRADIFRPASQKDKPLPAILAWSPYGKTDALSGLEKFEAPDPAEWCPRGYAVVQPDARGAYHSEGDVFMVGTQEGRDGHDTIEWIAKQPWSNEAVAMAGNSWLAMAQWFIAAEKPPHLKAFAPWEGVGDFYRETICRGGIPNPAFWDVLCQDVNGLNLREDVATMAEKYPLWNAYWEDKKPKLANIDIPMYALASYSSQLHTEGSIRGWKYASSKQKWLRIHATHEWHDIYQPHANDDMQRFLDHFLLGKDNGWEQTPKVRVSLLRYNRPPISFRPEDDYPPKRVQYQNFLLNANDGSLNLDSATALSQSPATTSYQSDTWDDDGAHFTHTFDKYTELIGSSKATLFMSCNDLDDLDVYIVLRKLDHNGKALLNYNIPKNDWNVGVTEDDIPDFNTYKYVGPSGRLRASKRALGIEPGLTEEQNRSKTPAELWFPHDKSDKVPRGEVVKLEIPIWPGGIAFEAGESIRLEIKGHDPLFPEHAPLYRLPKNQNKGRHVVHTGGEHRASLLLPLA
ncbi:Alpha/Beta hydrolase protein [Ilyonectria sp. MPI-CAGE-AT-0026]|nr:Alpha/Beta hydrolase protein [Ilyonectria sp. MPI-CAGE-AT-0026]